MSSPGKVNESERNHVQGGINRIAFKVGEFFVDKRWYFLAFFLPAAIVFCAYAFLKVEPFGKNSVLVLDLNGQYVYYYEAFRDAFHGDGSFIYNWSRNLGGEMFGIFAYYLASPFMLIPVLLPRSIMPYSVMIMQLAKIGTASVTFRFFLKKISGGKAKKLSLIIFPLMYSVMGYMIVQLMDPMWLDGLILLPLICWGVQRIVREEKMLPYIIPLALMFITHFYIGYMVGIFTFFYFCYVCLTQKERKLPLHFFTKCVYFCVGTLVALMCAAFVLIPVYNSLKLGKFEFTDPDFSLKNQFDFMTLLTKMFPMTYDTCRPEGMPVVYCGVCALFLVPLYFLNDKIYIKEKVGMGLLTSLIAVLMYIKPADMAMHGFQVPNWLPFRYSFIFSFLVIVMAFRAFENLNGITFRNIGGVFFGLLIFLFWCERENIDYFKDYVEKGTDKEKQVAVQGIWLSLIVVGLYFALIYLSKKYGKSRILCFAMTGIIGGELLLNAADTMDKINKDVVYSTYASYEPYMSNLRSAVNMMKDFDREPFYRMEANFHRTVNDAIGSSYYGISHSSSVMNAKTLSAIQKLGFSYGGHYVQYQGATPMTDTIFGIKYLMTKNGDTSNINTSIKIPEQYKIATSYKAGKTNFEFYKNPNYYGTAIVAKGDLQGIELSEKNPFENQNRVFNAITGDETKYFTKLDIINREDENVLSMELDNGDKKYYQADQSMDEVHKDYVVRMNRDSHLYMFFPAVYKKSVNVWTKNEDKYQSGDILMDYAGQFFENDNYAIMDLGKFLKDEEVRVRLTIANDEKCSYWSDELFYSFDYDGFSKKCSEIKNSALNISKFDDTYIEGTVNADDVGENLFTTIPYEDGWKITVNGKNVNASRCMEGLISIPLEQGENKITLEFAPDYYTFSVIISIAGLLVLLCVFVTEYKNGKYMKKIMEKMFGKKQTSSIEDESRHLNEIRENLKKIEELKNENDKKTQ